MRNFIVGLLIGRPLPYPTGQERIRTIRDALKWRLVSFAPWLDAYVREDGSVAVFRVR